MKFILFLSVLWSITSVGSFLRYKSGASSSWEDSLKESIYYIVAQIRELFNPSVEELDNQGFALTGNEPLQLVEDFEQHPYETPALANYQVKSGCMIFNVHAVGLSFKYSGFEENSQELTRLLHFKIYNYFLKTRGTPVYVFIRFATPTRLSFAVPFTDSAREKLSAYEAKRRLQQMQAQGAVTPGDEKMQSPQETPAVLEETVPAVKNDTEGGADDNRVSP